MNTLILIGAGLFTLIAAYADPDWYFESGKAKLWIAVFGSRQNARIALMIAGVIFIVIGFFV